MNNKKRLAALAINWNGAEDTLELLSSLCQCQADDISLTVVLIDNASTTDDRARLEAGLAQFVGRIDVVFRANNVNIGIPAAYNQAIQVVGLDYDYYLRLDNDVVVEPDGLRDMICALEEGKDRAVVIVGGNIKYFHRRTVDNGGAVAIDLVRGKTKVAYPSSEVVCDGVLGCIMLISGDVVRRYCPEVFDARLFINTDESELSLRAARDGMRTVYLGRLVGLHKSGRSTTKVKFVSTYYCARNWTLLRLCYAANRRQRLSVLIRTPLDIARSVARGRWAFPLGVLAGFGMAVTTFVDLKVRHGRC